MWARSTTGSSSGCAPENAKPGRPNWCSSSRSSWRALRTGPITGGTCEEKMVRKRVRPPSTGITYTMSAELMPVCGRANTMLSIFTASTRRSDLTGSPVNGDSSRWWLATGWNVAAFAGASARTGLRCTGAAFPVSSAAAVAAPATTTTAEAAVRI